MEKTDLLYALLIAARQIRERTPVFRLAKGCLITWLAAKGCILFFVFFLRGEQKAFVAVSRREGARSDQKDPTLPN